MKDLNRGKRGLRKTSKRGKWLSFKCAAIVCGLSRLFYTNILKKKSYSPPPCACIGLMCFMYGLIFHLSLCKIVCFGLTDFFSMEKCNVITTCHTALS